MLCLLSVLMVAIFPAYDNVLADEAQVETQSVQVDPSAGEDTTAPETIITVPIQDYTAGRTTIYKGYATDKGGSGINRVQIAIRDTDTELWFNFTNRTFGPITDSSGRVGITNAKLSETTVGYADWSISITLPDGAYQFFALAIDNAGNSQYSGKGVWPVNLPFTVK